MKLATWKNIATQALKPRRFSVMVTKVLERMTERGNALSREFNATWIATHLSDFSVLAESWNSALWAESLGRARTMEAQAQQILERIPYNLGGGGAYPFLHFLARYLRPQNIVETGVAAGYSSYAFLDALDLNGRGTLYSSDFPYFRLPDPEQFIGVVVPARLRHNWHLYVEGDAANLLRILNDMAGPIDLFHYDSDKSYIGRKRAMEAVFPRLARDAVVIMDDIQDNLFFHDFVSKHSNGKPFWVFEFAGKYVGLLGAPVRGLRT